MTDQPTPGDSFGPRRPLYVVGFLERHDNCLLIARLPSLEPEKRIWVLPGGPVEMDDEATEGFAEEASHPCMTDGDADDADDPSSVGSDDPSMASRPDDPAARANPASTSASSDPDDSSEPPEPTGPPPEAHMRRWAKDTLGVRIEIVVGQPPLPFEWEGTTYELRCFFCGIASGEVERGPYAELRWVSRHHLAEYDFHPAFAEIVGWLRENR
jgi:hypothetical protein